MAVKQPSVLTADDLNDADEEILDALHEGRGTPSYLAERLDRNRSYVSQRLKRLAEHDILDKLGTGLYELVDDPRNGAGEDVVDVEDARDAYGDLLDARERVDQEAIDEALEELGDALGVEDV